MAYIPPNRRAGYAPASSNESKKVKFATEPELVDEYEPNHSSYRGRSNKSSYNHSDELERKLRESKENERELEYQNQKLITTIDSQNKQLEELKNELAWYKSNSPKVSMEEYNKLQQIYENYKSSASSQIKSAREKANNYDEMERKYQREILKYEEDLKHANEEVKRYKSSIDGLNTRIANLKKSQVVKAPTPSQPEQQPTTTQQPKTIEDPNMIPDDWKNIIQSVDYILEQDPKLMKRAGFNLPALKLTRDLLKSHQ